MPNCMLSSPLVVVGFCTTTESQWRFVGWDGPVVANLLIELALPRTDAGVYAQWVVMAVVWILVVWFTRRWSKDYRLFVYGLATVNAAWFAVRAIH